MGIEQEKYVSFTTFRRTGEPVSTAVWIVPLGQGRAGFTTGTGTGKVKRLRHTPRVTLQACDHRGRPAPGSHPVDGHAVVVTDRDPIFREVKRGLRHKYRVSALALQALAGAQRLLPGRGGVGNCAVVITLSEAAGQRQG